MRNRGKGMIGKRERGTIMVKLVYHKSASSEQLLSVEIRRISLVETDGRKVKQRIEWTIQILYPLPYPLAKRDTYYKALWIRVTFGISCLFVDDALDELMDVGGERGPPFIVKHEAFFLVCNLIEGILLMGKMMTEICKLNRELLIMYLKTTLLCTMYLSTLIMYYEIISKNINKVCWVIMHRGKISKYASRTMAILASIHEIVKIIISLGHKFHPARAVHLFRFLRSCLEHFDFDTPDSAGSQLITASHSRSQSVFSSLSLLVADFVSLVFASEILWWIVLFVLFVVLCRLNLLYSRPVDPLGISVFSCFLSFLFVSYLTEILSLVSPEKFLASPSFRGCSAIRKRALEGWFGGLHLSPQLLKSMLVCPTTSTLTNKQSSSTTLLRRSVTGLPTLRPRLLSTGPVSPKTVKRSAPSPRLFFTIFTASCSTFAYITYKRSLNETDPRFRSKAFPSFGGAPTVAVTDTPDSKKPS
ncbi:hypothetical protein VP01_3188g1 [Puccinia sorghi]|uniref:Uncharacterized protein n=1 Tax=Puccinia sorghi TaxID=27349 RepID=A0A0L6UYI3_9BASI|nr:hypothetical protein VP01_3188g1 [Puccinia sorghi]